MRRLLRKLLSCVLTKLGVVWVVGDAYQWDARGKRWEVTLSDGTEWERKPRRGPPEAQAVRRSRIEGVRCRGT